MTKRREKILLMLTLLAACVAIAMFAWASLARFLTTPDKVVTPIISTIYSNAVGEVSALELEPVPATQPKPAPKPAPTTVAAKPKLTPECSKNEHEKHKHHHRKRDNNHKRECPNSHKDFTANKKSKHDPKDKYKNAEEKSL